MTNLTTYGFIAIITAVFATYIYMVIRLHLCLNRLKQALSTEDTLAFLHQTPFAPLCEAFRKTISYTLPCGTKSNTPSGLYFTYETVCRCSSRNPRLMETGAATLVGLGLLGTFFGLTVGISGFNSSDTQHIQESIQSLLAGMSTAFYTSLAGMSLSLLYTFVYKKVHNNANKIIYALTEKIDDTYYIDDAELSSIREQEMSANLTHGISEAIREQLTFHDGQGETVTIANAIREILRESMEQTRALKAFSTDLALQLNDGFDEVLSRQMQQKILPLMENVDHTTQAIVSHIDKMAEQFATPAANLIQDAIKELKKSMSLMLSDFGDNLSHSATDELDAIARQLNVAAQAIAAFPTQMDGVSTIFQTAIEDTKKAIADITTSTAASNQTTMQHVEGLMQQTTETLSHTIRDVQDVMERITQNTQEQNERIVNSVSTEAEHINASLTTTMSTIQTTLNQSVQTIIDDVVNKQADLIALQEDATSQSTKLLDAYTREMGQLEKAHEEISATIAKVTDAQTQILDCTGHLQNVSTALQDTTKDFLSRMEEQQSSTQAGIDKLYDVLLQSGTLSEEYAEKFETIRQGLDGIFQMLQHGLAEYSNTVQETTQKYLDQYSTSLTATTDALQSTIQQQSEVVEMLTEALDKSHQTTA